MESYATVGYYFQMQADRAEEVVPKGLRRFDASRHHGGSEHEFSAPASLHRPVTDRRYLGNLEVLRFLAAVLVVFFHLQQRFAIEMGLIPELNRALGTFGSFGVDLFFVISGFVIALNISNPTITPYRFAASRVARILPNYWLLTSVGALAMLLMPHQFSQAFSAKQYLGSLLFSNQLFGFETPLISLGWTLNLEMIFYGIVALALCTSSFFRLRGQVYLLSALGLYLAVTVAGTDGIIYEFILGFLCFVAWKMLGSRSPLGYTSLVVGCVGIGLWLGEVGRDLPRWLNFGVPAFFLVLGVLLIRQLNFPYLKKLGFASYSIYLTQFFSIPVCVALITSLHFARSLAPLLFIISVLICTSLGVLYSLLVDQKLHFLARKALRV